MRQLRIGATVFIFLFLAIPYVFTQEKSNEWNPETNEEKIQRLSYNRKFDRALVVSKKALKAVEQKVGLDHVEVAQMLETIAELYYHQEQYFEVERPLKRSLAIKENALGQYSKAEQLYLRIVAIREKELGTDDPLSVFSLNNLAALYSDQKRYDEAKILYNRALEMLKPAAQSTRDQVLQGEFQVEVTWITDPDLALVQNDLANLYTAEGNYGKAKSLYKKALAMRKKTLGPDHPATAKTLNNIAELYRVQGKNKQAERSLTRALAINEKTLGSEHPEAASCLENLVALYRATERKEEAEKLEQRATRIRAIQR